MADNQKLLEELIDSRWLRANRSHVFDEPAPWAGQRVASDRWRGMLVGLAIGDALGNTSEAMLLSDRRAKYGEIRDYLPNRHADSRSVGLPSDDTQLCFWALETVLERGWLNLSAYAQLLRERHIFGIGRTVSAFIEEYGQTGDWKSAAQNSAGNGALMRCPAALVPHLSDGSKALWADAALFAAVTHNNRAAISSAVAFTAQLGALLVMERVPSPEWWCKRYAEIACPIEGGASLQMRGGEDSDYNGPVSSYVKTELPKAFADGLDVSNRGARWYSGAFLLETVPAVLYILMHHADDPEEAIVQAVNHTRDNDTVAAIVGAAVGALHGESALPRRWRNGLLGRTRESDDGQVQRILNDLEDRLSL